MFDKAPGELNLLENILTNSKKTSLLAGKETLYQAYDLMSGIHDYVRQAYTEKTMTDPSLKRPLSSVAMHKAEEYTGSESQLGRLVRLFADLKIGPTFQLSLTEFLDLPVEYAEIVMRAAKDSMNRDSAVTQNVMNDLQKASDQSKK